MTKRYYVPDLPQLGGTISLPPSEAQHAIRVMRIKVGEAIELFNGQGLQAEAMIEDVKRNACICQANAACSIDREPKRKVRLAIALPKPDRAKELIERLTELGVQSVTPIIAERTQRGPTDSTLEKLFKVIIEACKQSGRNQLMQLKPTMKSLTFFQSDEIENKVIAHPVPDGVAALTYREAANDKAFSIAIGPEGGWTDHEYQAAIDQGYSPINLGKRIYRIETAAVALAANLID